MNVQFGIITIASVLGFTGLVLSFISSAGNRRNRNLLQTLIEQNEMLSNELADAQEELQQIQLRDSDHSRRIAWLETRVRKPEKFRKDILSQEVLVEKPAAGSNMTERRHRVLTLASHGQDSDSIASALKMLKGEVELIISLGRGSNKYA